MPTPASIRTRYPGVFDAPAVTDDSLNAAIAAAQQQVNSRVLGGLLEEATTLLACHFAELGKPGRAGGAHRARAGLVELDYGQGSITTSFMQLYKELVKRIVPPLGPATPPSYYFGPSGGGNSF